MEEIYVNVEFAKHGNPLPSTNHTGPRSSKRSFYLGVIVFLGLLSVFLLIGLIMFGVHYHESAAELSDMSKTLSSMTEERDLLKANLSTMNNELSSMTEERDLLKANLYTMNNKLSSMTEERDLLKANLYTMNKKLSSMTEERDLLKANLYTMNNKLSSMTEERDLLHASLTEKTKELERLQHLSKQINACPAGWSRFRSSCYLLSKGSGSWDEARNDCRGKGADLVVIESPEEQVFLSTISRDHTWIGLNDKEQEGQWKWVDGTPLSVSNWERNEPNNGGSQHGEEDCVHLRTDEKRTWNDISCTVSLNWICEKIP